MGLIFYINLPTRAKTASPLHAKRNLEQMRPEIWPFQVGLASKQNITLASRVNPTLG